MPLNINLPDGRTLLLDESTGSIVGEQSADHPNNVDNPPKTPPQSDPAAPEDAFDPSTDQVTDIVKLPGGQQITYIKNGKVFRTFVADDAGGSSGGGGVTASTAYAQQQQNARDAAGLAENQRQFNEQFGMDKAKFNTTFNENKRQFDASQALDQGKTLLGLQNQPGTLYRYLHALGGQLPPQALNGQNPALPGFPSTYALGQQGAGAAAPVAAPAAAPTAAAPVAPQGLVAGADRAGQAGYWNSGDATHPASFIPGAASAPSAPPRATSMQPQVPSQPVPQLPGASATSTGYASPYQGLSGFNTDGTLRLAPNDLDAANLMAKYPGQYRIGFEKGGVIPEPVMGMGMMSGQKYMFGEKGPEAVVPNDIFEKLMSKHDGEMSYSEDDGKKKRSIKLGSADQMSSMPTQKYAAGGTIGYNPTDLFNPPDLAGIVQRGYNTTPDVPLFPDVGIATGGGQSLIPSAQRMNSLLPSQQQSYAGFLQDEAGVQAQDVFALADKIGPKVRGLTTPRYV